MKKPGRLMVVSNRLPVTVDDSGQDPKVRPSGGGLVSALVPILSKTGGTWVGWTGADYDERAVSLLKESCSGQKFTFEPVFLTAAERASYYQGFSNEIIWPLFHALPSRCQFDSIYWDGYCQVNEKFADAVQRASEKNSFVWIHDYHLMVLARAIRSRGMRQRLAYFHHIPFPALDIFETLPWRNEVLRALLQFDLIGFQTARDRDNFAASVDCLLRDVSVSRAGDSVVVCAQGHTTKVGTYPISVDYGRHAWDGAQLAVNTAAEKIRNGLRTRILLGVDRLDYTKGIPERLMAFQKFLERNTDLHGRITMVQIVVPSREEIPEYRQLKHRIETLVSKINGQYSSPAWIPVHYFYRSVSQTELMSFYRAADIALVTPLKDGMNLVAKEFCASRADNRGVLIVSEFAGAAEELKGGALVVNPHDTQRVASAIGVALRMSESEQRGRMEAMRSHIRVHDVFHWARSFAAECSAPDLAAAQRESGHWFSRLKRLTVTYLKARSVPGKVEKVGGSVTVLPDRSFFPGGTRRSSFRQPGSATVARPASS